MHDILVQLRINYYSAIHVVLRPLTSGFLQCAAELTLLIGTPFAILPTLMYRHFKSLRYYPFSFLVLCSSLHLSPIQTLAQFFFQFGSFGPPVFLNAISSFISKHFFSTIFSLNRCVIFPKFRSK